MNEQAPGQDDRQDPPDPRQEAQDDRQDAAAKPASRAVSSPGAWTAAAPPGKPDGEVDTRGR